MAQSGYTPILIYASGTASALPSAANLTSSANGAELALNYADGKLYYKNSSGVVTLLASAAAASGTSPGGSTTQVQYNNAGAFAGSANFVWDNSNVRLGIGTSSPAVPLDVVAQTSASIARFRGRSSDNIATLEWYDNTNATRYTYISSGPSSSSFWNQANTPMAFGTNDTERMRINAVGQVGVGTTNPSTQFVVSNNGANGIEFDPANAKINSYNRSTSAFTSLSIDTADTRFLTSSTERMRIDSSGNVGIGTTSPGQKLDVQGTSGVALQVRAPTATNGPYLGLRVENALAKIYWTWDTIGAIPLSFEAGGTERMRIDSSGNVGIGTSSPGYRLDVQDAIRIKVDGSNNANLYFNATSTRLYYSDGSGNLSFYTNSTERMIVGYAGGITINYSLGVGTTASGTTGEIRATNNITAYYSDDRLKTRLGSIENALDKVCQLDGFFYEANQTAQDLGYKPVREVGVSAQQVQAVLPEIVVPAPIDEKYLTVRYEKMIPLLVEAIKELRAEVKALRGE